MALSISGLTWNIGVGPKASFTRALSRLAMKRYDENVSLLKYMIKVDLKPTSTADEAIGSGMTSIKYQMAVAVAKELGLLDEQYNMLKQRKEELEYYTYGCNQDVTSRRLEEHVRFKIVSRIIKQLSTKRYFLVVENLQWPVETVSFTQYAGLPPLRWAYSQWFISTTSHEAYNKSKSENDKVLNVHYEGDVVVLVLFALRLSAEHMVKVICQGNEDYWHHIVIDCFHYAMAVFSRHSNGVLVTPDELIYQWAAQGILTRTSNEQTGTCSSKCSYVHRVGRVILEAFQKYSLLQLPFSPANDSNEATTTAAQFLAYHDLIAEGTTVQELFENQKNWISFTGDCGWHVSRQWLISEETNNGPTALILRDCRKPQDVELMLHNKLQEMVQKQSAYLDVYSSCNAEVNSITSLLTAPVRQTDRHLEIFGMQQTPDGLAYLMKVTRSILVTCDNSISCLYSSFNRNPSDISDMEECELHECHKMERVFALYREDLKNLRNVHACNLKRLVMFCTRSCTSAFSSLERMHLEYCPRLEHMVPLGIKLPCLQTIDIMFCYNLKTIFNCEDSKDIISYQLPGLQRIRLQELPLLQHFDYNNTTIMAPMWKELHIRGCWSLRRLPRLQDQLKMVKVSGERSWWNKLRWDSPSHCKSYVPKIPPAFASFDERVEVTSYLR
uniref:Uncharacterized protein n=1 Tax=Avena sativa TaxID=4498 RepID=A0ACD5TY98_AVESA